MVKSAAASVMVLFFTTVGGRLLSVFLEPLNATLTKLPSNPDNGISNNPSERQLEDLACSLAVDLLY